MNRQLHATGTVQGVIAQMSRHAEFIAELFEKKHVEVLPEESDRYHMVMRLSRERIVRCETMPSGLVHVTMMTDVRRMFRQATQHHRLQEGNINIGNTFDVIDTSVEKWRDALAHQSLAEAEEEQDVIEEALGETNNKFSEKLASIKDKITVDYGFDTRISKRIADFRFYIREMDALSEAALDFMERINSDAYRDIPFIQVFAGRMDSSFRQHGQTITRLQRSLQQYLARLRQRQEITRRRARFLQWLRRHPNGADFRIAQARADEQDMFQRSRALEIGGTPDIENPLYSDALAAIALRLRKRRRQQLATLQNRRPRSASAVEDHSQLQAEAAAEYERAGARQWDPTPWVNWLLADTVRRAMVAKDEKNEQGLSAMDFWHRATAKADGEVRDITARAWLAEVLQMIDSNRTVQGNRRFTDDFRHVVEMSSDDTLWSGSRVVDVRLRPLESTMRRARQARQHQLINGSAAAGGC